MYQLGSVVIEDDVEIGANTTIDRGALEDTTIGRNSKLDNQVQIGHGVKVGERCIICGASAIGGSTIIGNGCTIGGAVGITDHLIIVDNVQITARSLVTESIYKEGSIWSSSIPAQDVREWRRNVAILRRLHRVSWNYLTRVISKTPSE